MRTRGLRQQGCGARAARAACVCVQISILSVQGGFRTARLDRELFGLLDLFLSDLDAALALGRRTRIRDGAGGGAPVVARARGDRHARLAQMWRANRSDRPICRSV